MKFYVDDYQDRITNRPAHYRKEFETEDHAKAFMLARADSALEKAKDDLKKAEQRVQRVRKKFGFRL